MIFGDKRYFYSEYLLQISLTSQSTSSILILLVRMRPENTFERNDYESYQSSQCFSSDGDANLPYSS